MPLPLERPPILLLSPGRAGSSLLQQVLNTAPEIAMWGEHGGFLADLARLEAKIASDDTLARLHFDRPRDVRSLIRAPLAEPNLPLNWVNAFTREDIASGCRDLVLRWFAPGIDRRAQHFGFKEIRYGGDEVWLAWWRRHFPDTKWIFLVREPAASIRSMYLAWRNRRAEDEALGLLPSWLETAALRWAEQAGGLARWHERDDLTSYLLRFEDLTRAPEATITHLFAWLGIPLPPRALEPFAHFTEAKTADKSDAAHLNALIAAHRPRFDALTADAARALGYRA